MDFNYGGKEIKKVGIFGLGKSNIGVIRYLSKKHPEIRFTLRSDNEIDVKDAMRVTNFDRILTKEAAISKVDEEIIFLSPSTKRERFCGCGAILSSDAELFFKNAKREIYAVSGSDGKSTTATLASLILLNSGIECSCIGNVGEAMTPHTDECFAAVVELSSFQLKYIDTDFGRTLITNITPNHLDWHSSLQDYIESKSRLMTRAKEPILNADDEISQSIKGKAKPFAVFSLAKSEKEIMGEKSELYGYLKDGFICVNGEKILDTGAIISKNKYNLANFLAAILLTHGKANQDGIYRVAQSFTTLKHRCETVFEHCGISYVDSSIDSSPQRTITTFKSLNKEVIVIIGGRSKGLDYSILLPHLIRYAKAVILTGESGIEILKLLEDCQEYTHKGILTKYIPCFGDAVLYTTHIAKAGDTVLLSPASTSYDSFKNFEERGDKFKEIITNHYRGY